jgi:hypothetical protein
MYAVEQVSGQVETNPELRKTMDELKKYINSGVLR